jgi:hypothetical protein
VLCASGHKPEKRPVLVNVDYAGAELRIASEIMLGRDPIARALIAGAATKLKGFDNEGGGSIHAQGRAIDLPAPGGFPMLDDLFGPGLPPGRFKEVHPIGSKAAEPAGGIARGDLFVLGGRTVTGRLLDHKTAPAARRLPSGRLPPMQDIGRSFRVPQDPPTPPKPNKLQPPPGHVPVRRRRRPNYMRSENE